MQELLRVIVAGLVEDPTAIQITEDAPNEEGVIVYHLHVAPDDTGRVIGKQGRIAKAIRVIMRSGAQSIIRRRCRDRLRNSYKSTMQADRNVRLFLYVQKGLLMKQYLEIGKIVNVHGLRGDMKVVPWCDDPGIPVRIRYPVPGQGAKAGDGDCRTPAKG